MKIAIGSDHAGYEYKGFLIDKLKEWGHEAIDCGTNSPISVDYPDFAHPVADKVSKGIAQLGILICGSANGVAMTANKHQDIRAAISWTSEIAQLSREHNDANVVCIPARFITQRMASSIVKTFLETTFEGGRHGRRVGKIACQ